MGHVSQLYNYIPGMTTNRTLLEITGNSPETANTVMPVGHNPGMEVLLLYLAGIMQPRNLPGKKIQ